MKALVYHGPGTKAWEDVPDARVEESTDVVVKVKGRLKRDDDAVSISAQELTLPDITDAPSGPPSVPVTISVELPAGAPTLNEVPVRVAITTATHPNVLLVPVTALLARPGGGYQVRLAGGRTATVRPGLFDDATGLVEVSGPGLTAGQKVRVPA